MIYGYEHDKIPIQHTFPLDVYITSYLIIFRVRVRVRVISLGAYICVYMLHTHARLGVHYLHISIPHCTQPYRVSTYPHISYIIHYTVPGKPNHIQLGY
jgi:hypothetical protein